MTGNLAFWCPRRCDYVAAEDWHPRPMVQLNLFFEVDPDAEHAALLRELMGVATT